MSVQPVSRVWFELSDTLAFDRCIELSVGWMKSRAEVDLPSEAWSGDTFDVTDQLGANPAKAIRINAADGKLWVARLDWPDPLHPRTWVSEFFAEHRRGSLSRFGAQVTCVVRGESPRYDITRPTVVREVLAALSAEADEWPLVDRASMVGSVSEVQDLVSLIFNPSRRLPVVVMSESSGRTTLISPDTLARQIAGAAHIIHLSEEAARTLTHVLGKRMSVFAGAVRLYLPGLTEENEDPYQHPLWLMQPFENLNLIKRLAERVLPMAFLRDGNSECFPRFAAIRKLVAKDAAARSPSRNVSQQLEQDFGLLKVQYDEIVEQCDAWMSLAESETSKTTAAEAEIERLKQEVARLQAKTNALEHHLQSRGEVRFQQTKPERRLNSYADLEDWADEVLADSIYIHQAALSDCRKNGHDKMLERIEKVLLVIRDFWIPARINGGLDRRKLTEEKLAQLGMEDTPCFVDKTEAKRTSGYSVNYEGETVILADHIKYGNGYNNSNQLRIYYFWDDAKKKFVIGKMPSHLPNNLTT